MVYIGTNALSGSGLKSLRRNPRGELKAFEFGIGMAEQIFVCGNHEASCRSLTYVPYSGLAFVAVIGITNR